MAVPSAHEFHWQSLARLPCGRVYHSLTEVGGQMYMLGGCDAAGRPCPALELYSPEVLYFWTLQCYIFLCKLPVQYLLLPFISVVSWTAKAKIYVQEHKCMGKLYGYHVFLLDIEKKKMHRSYLKCITKLYSPKVKINKFFVSIAIKLKLIKEKFSVIFLTIVMGCIYFYTVRF